MSARLANGTKTFPGLNIQALEQFLRSVDLPRRRIAVSQIAGQQWHVVVATCLDQRLDRSFPLSGMPIGPTKEIETDRKRGLQFERFLQLRHRSTVIATEKQTGTDNGVHSRGQRIEPLRFPGVGDRLFVPTEGGEMEEAEP